MKLRCLLGYSLHREDVEATFFPPPKVAPVMDRNLFLLYNHFLNLGTSRFAGYKLQNLVKTNKQKDNKYSNIQIPNNWPG